MAPQKSQSDPDLIYMHISITHDASLAASDRCIKCIDGLECVNAF